MSAADPRTWFTSQDLPWVERPDWRDAPVYRTASEERRDQADRFHRDGFLSLPSVADAQLRRAAVDSLRSPFATTGLPRLTDVWTRLEPARRLASLPPVLEVLAFLYGRSPLPFQTLDFRVGTQQPLHSDVIHFNSLPPRFMCGVWIALEEVGPGQGPLRYIVGSHHRPEVCPTDVGCLPSVFDHARYEEHMAATVVETGLEAELLTSAAGDAFIWSANLIHGGAPIERAGSTRWSHVTHYFFDDCLYYTPMRSDLTTGALALRDPVIDISTGRRHRPPAQLGGRNLRLRAQGAGLTRVEMDPPGSDRRGRRPQRDVRTGARSATRYARATLRLLFDRVPHPRRFH